MDISDGYEQAHERVAEALPKLVVGSADELLDVEKVGLYLKSAVMSKQLNYADFISQLVAKACGGSSLRWDGD